ncbi:MAG: biopolymer transporter ExbD [Betaproteobacteria bacterium]|nr:biopolymer transporter ExbD [Betaproteobacteria bacterium]
MALGTLGTTNRPMAEINMIPLIDVMLVLLVIFIVTAPLLTHAVKIELPKAASQPNTSQMDHIEVAVQRDGQLYWNGQPVTAPELERYAAQLAASASTAEIHLKGDDAVPYGNMARVLSLLARQGLSHIGFVTEPPK